MTETKGCKGCTESVRLTEAEIETIFGRNMKVKAVKLVSEEIYAERMQTCSECPALQYGTTCKHCGCLVQIKAKLIASQCPYPYAPKW